MERSKTSADPSEPLTGIGAAAESFKQARLDAGLTQDQVADALKITRERVIRLESGTLENLPPLIYVKGYVREFERLLGLEQQSIEGPYIRAIEEHTNAAKNSAPPIQSTVQASPGQRISMFLRAHPGRVLTAVLLLALAGITFAAWRLFVS